MFAARDLAGALVAGPAAEFARGSGSVCKTTSQVRNHSILVHGFKSIGEDGWRKFGGWLETALLPMPEAEARVVGIRQMPG